VSEEDAIGIIFKPVMVIVEISHPRLPLLAGVSLFSTGLVNLLAGLLLLHPASPCSSSHIHRLALRFPPDVACSEQIAD
jgi:hypothetical protein